MKAGNVDQLLRMLKPDDGMYGFYKLSNSDAEKLVKLYKDRGVLRGVSSLAEAKKILWESTYKGDRKDVYGADLIKSGALEVPGPLKGLSVKAIREKLTKHKMYSYTFRVSFEGNYKNAIKVLQQSLNISVTGRYTEDVARAVYEKVKGDIPKKKGYLASEDDPDRLFKSGFQEYVFCVDKVVWELCGVDEQWLKDDGHGIWTSTTALPVDNECQEALHYIEMYGVEEAKSLCSHRMKIRQIFTLGEKKAREILDELMMGMQLFGGDLYSIEENSYGEKFKTLYDEEKEKYTHKIFLKTIFPKVADYLEAALENPDAVQSIIHVKEDSLSALYGAFQIFLEAHSPGPGIGEVLEQNIPEPSTQNVMNAYNLYQFIENSQWKYLIANVINDHRGQFIQSISDEIDELETTPLIYSSSKLETQLYNEIIIRYLSDVRQINENFQAYKPYLDEKLIFHRKNRN